MPEPQQARSRNTQEKVLHAAAHLFADMGYAASYNDIAEVSGVNKSTILHHFRRKEALAEAVFAAGTVKDEDEDEPTAEPALLLPTVPFSWAQMISDQSGRLAALTAEIVAVRAAHRLATEPASPVYRGSWAHYQPGITRILQLAHESGELLPWVEADLMATTWIAAFTGHWAMRQLDPENLPVDIYHLNRTMVGQCVRQEIARNLDLSIERGRELAKLHPVYAKAKSLPAISPRTVGRGAAAAGAQP